MKTKFQNQDFELNLASIIDCLTVLLTFMLASASFLSVGILDAGVTAAGTQSLNEVSPKWILTLKLKKNYEIQLLAHGKEKREVSLSSQKSKWDLSGLHQELQNLKSNWPELSSLTLVAESSVEYQDVIHVMDEARKVVPHVMLGGF